MKDSIKYDTFQVPDRKLSGMGEKKVNGYIFRIYKMDHPPYHVHIYDGHKELGRFDIENQKPLDKHLVLDAKLRKALKKGGYLK